MKEISKINFEKVWNLIPFPCIFINIKNVIISTNHASELYFLISSKNLVNRKITDVVKQVHTIETLINSVREKQETIIHYDPNFASSASQNNYHNVHIIPYSAAEQQVLIIFETKGYLNQLKKSLSYKAAAKSVAGMSSMLAHEIRNPLAGIYGAAELLENSVSNSDKELTILIQKESKRIGKLVDTFEKFGEIRPLHFLYFNVHDVLDRSIQSIETAFKGSVTVAKDYDPSLPDVFGDADQIFQVFQNLIKNSFEAIGERPGKIKIQTKFRLGFKNLPLVITISDDGPGRPSSIQDHIFQPFITSKAHGGGLGLSLVSKIISDHNGIIDFISGETGTKFRLLMPRKKVAKDVESDLEYLQLESQ